MNVHEGSGVEQHLNALCEFLPDAVIVVDHHGAISSVNSHTETLFGYPRTELLGRSIETLIPEHRRARHVDQRTAYHHNAYVREMGSGLDLTALKKDGTEFPVEISLSPLRTGDHPLIICVIHDISDRRKIETAHRESEERYRSLVELSPEAIIVHVRGTIVYANQAVARLFVAESPEQLIGTSLLDFVPADYRAMIRQRMESPTATRDPVLVKGRRIDGQEFHLEVVAERIRIGGEPAAQVIMRDITARIRAEEELRASQQQLRNLSTHLQSAREEERTLIAREIHDELGQALTALKLDVASLEDALAGPVVEHATWESKTRSMSDLIDATIATVRRIATQLRPVLLDSLGLVPAIEWLVEDFQSRTGIACGLIVEPDDLETDNERATALYRILQEALTNVIRHARATIVTVRVKHEHASLVLEVRDNGVGLPVVKDTQTKSFGLLGIRERVRIFGGEVAIMGPHGEGTTITVRIPL